MEASRAEYLADYKFKQQVGPMESSTSGAEPSSSAASEWLHYHDYAEKPMTIIEFFARSWTCKPYWLVNLSWSPGSDARQEGCHDQGPAGSVLNGSMQQLLSMGFSYMQVIEANSIFWRHIDSMICYLIETSSSGRNKGKATEK